MPYCVGWTEGPSNIVSLILQRNRWQRVVIETVWHYKHMVTKRGHGLFALFIFVRDQKIFKTKDIVHFVILSFLEFFWYRWIIAIAKLAGTLAYARGVKVYDTYSRKKRNS